MTEEEMIKLWGLQQDFKSRLLASKHLMRAARSQLKELLSAARWSTDAIKRDQKQWYQDEDATLHGWEHSHFLQIISLWRHITDRQGCVSAGMS